jgi:hypothetical protein
MKEPAVTVAGASSRSLPRKGSRDLASVTYYAFVNVKPISSAEL